MIQLLTTAIGFDARNMQALPIYLDKLFNQYVAIILSVTFVLFFGEVYFLKKFQILELWFQLLF